jgi:hypothetical protein
MPKNHQHIFFILMLCCYQVSFSQLIKVKKDTSETNRESQSYLNKKRNSPFINGINIDSSASIKRKKKQLKHLEFEGKIIRNITITTLDPFGYSHLDTTIKPKGWIQKTGNSLHLKTKKFTIRNLLLLKKNSPFDSLKSIESERLIRTQDFVTQASITQELTSPQSDSIDVFVRVLDSWSTIIKGSFVSSQSYIELNERNFLGLGHRLDNRYTNQISAEKKGYNFEYTVPNIQNTFIRTTLGYHVDVENSNGKSIDIARPFYSPLTKWAVGIYLDQQFRKDTLQGPDLLYAPQSLKFQTQDYWMGKSFRLFKRNNSKARTTNLILSGRYLNLNYLERPSLAYDSIRFYNDERFFLTGIGISTRKFVKDSHIFRNGIVEDVPIGRIYGITAGYQYKNNNWRPYVGCRVSFGNYHEWGFLSTNFEIGTFFNQSNTEQSTFSFQANYFTKIISLGNWKLRQFIKPQIIIGINRFNTIEDQLTINEIYGVRDFNSGVFGTKKMRLTLQTQAYAPWDLWGFRLNPYFNYSIALLANSENGFKKNKAYSKLGIGLIINNDYLIFSSFQISIAYFPTTPFNGKNIFRINAFETSDFGLQDFELAKPRTVPFK